MCPRPASANRHLTPVKRSAVWGWLRWVFCFTLACGAISSPGQEAAAAPESDFEKNSITLRTALHYDPAALPPLQRLVAQYESAGRSEELLNLYHQHLQQYPQDENARVVLARLYMAWADKRTEEFIKASTEAYPTNPLLAWIQASWWQQQHDPRAVAAMARAVGLETTATRRGQWYGELMKLAAPQHREDLVLEQTKKFIQEGAMSAEQRLRWARQAFGLKLARTAALMIEGLKEEALGGDSAVDLTVLRAEIQASAGQKEPALQTLDTLLARLAPEYWRRREILMLRLDLTGQGKERDALIEKAREQWSAPNGKTEINALNLTEVLVAGQRTQEGLKVLKEAVAALPHSRQLEQRLMELWEQVGIDAEALKWLNATLTSQPERDDLALVGVKWHYAANQSKEASAALDKLLTKLDPADQVTRSVEVARWLRRRNQMPEAATLLEGILRRSPARWDLRRELAEIYFAQQRKDDAAQLFTGDWSRDLPPDARLEIAQFLLIKQLWIEARDFTAPWLEAQQNSFDGLLLMAKIHDKLRDDTLVQQTLDQARALCDTDVRYQAWLDTALAYALARENVAAWIESEAARLQPQEGQPWDAVSLQRWTLLMEQAVARNEPGIAEGLIHKVLADTNLPEDRRVALERVRLEMVGLDKLRAVEAERGYQEMILKDPKLEQDYRLRLALLYHETHRHDLAREYLMQVKAEQCQDVDLMRRALPICQSMNLSPIAIALGERLVVLEPAERNNWVQLITLLAVDGQEERLRSALRATLAKGRDWALDENSFQELRTHLVSSQWRSVLVALSKGKEGWAMARRYAAQLYEMELTKEQRIWADWLVAMLSVRLGDLKGVDSALTVLDKLPGDLWLPFPDGMELSVVQASNWLRRLVDEANKDPQQLKSEQAAAAKVADAPLTLQPPFGVQWGFRLPADRTLVKIDAPPGDDQVYLHDDSQTIYAVQLRTGKLVWSLSPSRMSSGAAPQLMGVPARRIGRSRSRVLGGGVTLTLSVPTYIWQGKLAFVSGDVVSCVSTKDGSLLWRSELNEDTGANPLAARPYNRLEGEGDRVYIWSAASTTAYAMGMNTGKLLWQTTLPAPADESNQNPYNNPFGGGGYQDPQLFLRSGLSVDRGRVFVYSQTAGLLDGGTGAVLWRLSQGQSPGFPIALTPRSDSPEDAKASRAVRPPVALVNSFRREGHSIFSSMIRDPFGYTGGGQGRWAYTSGLRVALHGSFGGKVVLNGDEVWQLPQHGAVHLSLMGLPINEYTTVTRPIARLPGGGLAVADDRGQGLKLRVRDAEITLNSATASSFVSVGPRPPDSLTGVTFSGQRFYTCRDGRLLCSDAVTSVQLFDAPMPPEALNWAKEGDPPTVANAYAAMGFGRAQQYDPFGLSLQQTFTPSGYYVANQQGSGIMIESNAAVSGGYWIVPVRPGAVVCLVPATAPAPAPTTSPPAPAQDPAPSTAKSFAPTSTAP